MKKRIRKLLAVLIAAALTAASFELNIIPARADDTFTAVFDVVYDQTGARSMLDYINLFRAGNDVDGQPAEYWNQDNSTKTVLTDLEPLVYDYSLERTAMQRAAELAVSYSHTRPDGSRCFTAWDDSVFWYAQGENIAAGYNSYTTAYQVFAGWREDDDDYSGQGHRRNMLSGNFTRIGIAHVRYNGVEYWAQSFGKGSGDDAAAAAADETRTVSVNVAASGLSNVSLSAEPGAYALTVGDTVPLPAVTMNFRTQDSWPSFQSVTAPVSAVWTSGDEAVVSVNGGVIRAESAGSTTLTGSIYGASVSVTVTAEEPAHIHVPGETIIENEIPAACTSEGSYDEAVYCTACGAELSRVTKTVAMTAHSLKEVPAAAATCTEDGCEAYWICSSCSRLFSDDEGAAQISEPVKIKALGHSWSEWNVTIPATEETEGQEKRVCSRCKETQTQVIPPLIHVHVLESIPAVPATCTEAGSIRYWRCIGCGKYFADKNTSKELTDEELIVPASGHSFGDNGFCTECGEFRFTDITGEKTQTYVSWAYQNGIVKGTGENIFSPDERCTRSQFVMMLWKMNGSPEVSGKNPFKDVTGKKTVKAILWALNEGIIVSGKTFDPEGEISRAQIVMMLWKMSGSPSDIGANPFTDITGSKTARAVSWAYNKGIVKGISRTAFDPDSPCTRVQLVVMLCKYVICGE